MKVSHIRKVLLQFRKALLEQIAQENRNAWNVNGSQHVLTALVVAMQSMVTLLEQPITVRLQSYRVNGQLGIGRKLENMKEQMITSIMKTNSNVHDLEEMKHRAAVLITNADARCVMALIMGL